MTPLLAPTSSSFDQHGVSSSEYAQIAAGRLIYSRSCGAFYISLLAASLTEIVWILHPWADPMHCCRMAYPTSPLFFVVESYLTLGLIAETGLRFLWQRDAFWLQPANIFDTAVCGMSILSFLLYWRQTSEDLEIVVLLIMLSWLVLRIARLAAILQKIRERRRSTAHHIDIAFPDDFEDLSADDEPPHELSPSDKLHHELPGPLRV